MRMETPVSESTAIILGFVFLAIALIPFIIFLMALQKTMNMISPENRKMPPSNVWLMLIPLFNIVWQFIMVDKIAQSITAECVKLNIPINENKPTYNNGLAALITFILYWIKINEYKNLIIANKDNYMLDAEKNIFYGDKA